MTIVKNYKNEVVEIRLPTLSFIESEIGIYTIIESPDEYTKRIFVKYPQLRILEVSNTPDFLMFHNNIFIKNGIRRIILKR